MELLGIEIDCMQAEVLNEVSLYLFDNSVVSSGKKIFDLVKDFKYYYDDFIDKGIDLNTDKISWWKFNSILDGIFLKKESTIGKVIEYRTWEKPSKNGKKEELAYNSYMNKMRGEYSLDKNKMKENNLRTLVESARTKLKTKGE